MLPRILAIAAYFILSISFSFLSPSHAQEQVYIGPMHPQIRGIEGDTCPICGMALVPLEPVEMPNEEAESLENTIYIAPEFIQVLGVRTAMATQQNIGRSIRGFGRLAANTRLEYHLDMRRDGWITNLATSAVGDEVAAGDELFTYYSRDLLVDQSDYLRTLRHQDRTSRNISRQRLSLAGMDDAAIALLERRGDLLTDTPFHAPISGTITSLNIRNGSHVAENTTALIIQDFSQIWVEVELPISDLNFLSIGDHAIIEPPHTGIIHQSQIDYIHPIADANTRTGRVRLILDNPDGTLRPNSYVDVTFHTNGEAHLTVPTEALLYSSNGARLIRVLGEGRFEPLDVTTGLSADGYTAILSGLEEGAEIVISSQFLIDAESNLRGTMGGMSGMAGMSHDAETDEEMDMETGMDMNMGVHNHEH